MCVYARRVRGTHPGYANVYTKYIRLLNSYIVSSYDAYILYILY